MLKSLRVNLKNTINNFKMIVISSNEVSEIKKLFVFEQV